MAMRQIILITTLILTILTSRAQVERPDSVAQTKYPDERCCPYRLGMIHGINVFAL